MRKVIDKMWFTTGVASIGIVVTENNIGEHKAYIGLSEGLNEDADAEHIADHGSKIELSMIKKLEKVLEKK